MRGVLAEEQGTEKMQEIAGAIQEGALAYLRRQFRTIAIIVVPVAVVVFLTSTEIKKEDGGQVFGVALSFGQAGAFRTIAFLFGALFSGAIGFFGMSLAVRGNVRTAAAARRSDFPAALRVAFRTGGVAGLLTAGLGLLGAVVIIMIFQNTASSILVGFGFGGSLLALFLRVGGGIFTKAADVGADLVGKVEAGIPEDDPRNPATIADNVGDNVGDCAGMAADLFESFAVTLVASIILGVSAFKAIGFEGSDAAKGLIFPLAVMAVGLLASMVGIFFVKGRPGETNALKAINRGIYVAQILAVIGAAGIAFVYVGNDSGSNLQGTSPLSNPAPACSAPSSPAWCSASPPPRSPSTSPPPRPSPSRRSPRQPAPGRPPPCSRASRRGSSRRCGPSSPSPWPSAPPWRSAAATSASRSTWWLSPASACWPPPASSWPRTPSAP